MIQYKTESFPFMKRILKGTEQERVSLMRLFFLCRLFLFRISINIQFVLIL